MVVGGEGPLVSGGGGVVWVGGVGWCMCVGGEWGGGGGGGGRGLRKAPYGSLRTAPYGSVLLCTDPCGSVRLRKAP